MSNLLIHKNIKNMGDFIEYSLAKYPDNPAFHCFYQTMTFKEIDQKSYQLACWLQQQSGLVQGDRIIIQLPNIIQYPIAAYAALRAGLVLVNSNPQYTPREMQHQFKDSGAKALITLDSLLDNYVLIAEQTDIITVISTQPMDLAQPNIYQPKVGTSLLDAINAGESLSLQPRTSQLSDICILQYTGGTTGVAKGACLTHRGVLSNSAQTYHRIEQRCVDSEEIFICPLPLYHIYAFVVNMVMLFSHGNLNVLIPNPRDIDTFVDTMKSFKFTGLSGLNTLFIALSQNEEFHNIDFSALKLTISGGSALSLPVEKTWQKITGCSVTEGYGLSETSPVVCFNQPGNEQIGSIGKPLISTEVEIWDEHDHSLPDGEEGQIVVRGPQVMAGYWNMPQETALVMSNDGFFKTGDIGIKRQNGCIKIVDRLKDMIIVSGFNVYPNEIEEVLMEHPDVVESAVIGREDSRTGEKVCAYITVNADVDIEELFSWARSLLTPYKVPKMITVVDMLPKSTVGKILRRELRQVES